MILANFVNKLKFTPAMPGRKTTRHGLILTGVILIVIIPVMFFIPIRLNLVIETKDYRLLRGWDIKPGDEFVITYRHSVNKSPVEEYFLVKKDSKLLLTKTAFRSFGVGIPCEPEAGQKMIRFTDHIEIVCINRELPQILLAVGTIANHQITVGGKISNLQDFARPQQAVRIYIRKVSAYEWIRRGVRD